jgi:hypothetical protein
MIRVFLVLVMTLAGCAQNECTDGKVEVCISERCFCAFVKKAPVATNKCDTPANSTLVILSECWMAECVDGEQVMLQRSAGTNCILNASAGPDEDFSLGTCNGTGVCEP